tara:strand:- start:1987 stop:2922 length:936 start_codon:yes stop_codon:yes gene_type:complete
MLKINTLLIGLGNMALNYDYKSKKIQTHTKSLFLNKKINLILGIDPNKKQQKKFSDKYKIPTLKELSNIEKYKDIHFVVISTDKKNHLREIKKVVKIKSVKAILIEKPCGQNLIEFLKIYKLCKINRIKLFINYQRLYDKNFQRLDSILQSMKNFVGSAFYSRGFSNNMGHLLSIIYSMNFKKTKLKILKKGKNPNISITFKNGFIQFLNSPRENLSNNEIEIVDENVKLKSSNEINNFEIFNLKKDSHISQNFIFKKKGYIKFDLKYSQKHVIDHIVKCIQKNQSTKLIKKLYETSFFLHTLKKKLLIND